MSLRVTGLLILLFANSVFAQTESELARYFRAYLDVYAKAQLRCGVSDSVAVIGASVEDIDTPALVVDLDALDRNIAKMADFARSAGVRVWVVPTGSDEVEALRAAQPDRLLRDLKELAELVGEA